MQNKDTIIWSNGHDGKVTEMRGEKFSVCGRKRFPFPALNPHKVLSPAQV